GALVRTALASGAVGVVTVGVSDAFHAKAIRTSMGSVFKLPIMHAQSVGFIEQELGALHRIAAVSVGGVAPWSLSKKESSALVLGSEAFGLSPEIAAWCDERVTIPMPVGVDSFSVNAAAGVLLYELARPKD